jgi:glycosyltransferase involved in cell wall biosynthesis
MTTEPLRLAIVMTNAEQRGGSERLLQYLLRRADDSWRISIAFLEDGPMVEEARRHGHRVTVIPAPRFRQLLGTVGCILALRRWLRREKPQLVLGWMKKAHIYSGSASRGLAPAIWFQHENPGGQGIDRLIHRIRASGVLCCSDMVRKLQEQVTPRLAAKTVHPCQDVASEPPEAIAWPVAAGRKALVMVCRLQTWKGPHLAVQALRTLRATTHPDLELVVVGGAHSLEPDYPAALQAEIERCGLRKAVHLVGFQTAPASWMRKAAVVVHASHGEPFGMVVAEAIALGVPVVAARPGGPEEIVRPGVDGVLWNHPDTDDLARAIREAMELGRHPDHERFGVATYLATLRSALQGFLA